MYVREKESTSDDIYMTFLKSEKGELHGIGSIWAIGYAGKYLCIPVVTWCNIQVDIKCSVTNLEWWYWHYKYLINRAPPPIKRKLLLTVFMWLPYFLESFTKYLDLCNSREKQSVLEAVAKSSWGFQFFMCVIRAHVTGFSACICFTD